MTTRRYGTIRWYDPGRGLGVIRTDRRGGNESVILPFVAAAIAEGSPVPGPGQRCSLEVVTGRRGPMAAAVTALGRPPASRGRLLAGVAAEVAAILAAVEAACDQGRHPDRPQVRRIARVLRQAADIIDPEPPPQVISGDDAEP